MFAQRANRPVRSIGQVRADVKIGMDIAKNNFLSVKIPDSSDLLETIGLCRVFRGSLNTKVHLAVDAHGMPTRFLQRYWSWLHAG